VWYLEGIEPLPFWFRQRWAALLLMRQQLELEALLFRLIISKARLNMEHVLKRKKGYVKPKETFL
jgi:hypothetical protein